MGNIRSLQLKRHHGNFDLRWEKVTNEQGISSMMKMSNLFIKSSFTASKKMSWVIYGLPGNSVTKKRRQSIQPFERRSILNVLIKRKIHPWNVLHSKISSICSVNILLNVVISNLVALLTFFYIKRKNGKNYQRNETF